MSPVDEDGAGRVLREVLMALDDALAAVAERIPWAGRDGNCVIWREADVSEPVSDLPSGAGELFELCSEIRMADVGVGWFVHPLGRDIDEDPYVPRRVEGVGRCVALGSDGGGGWFVVTHDGRVWFLPVGRIVDGTYEASPGVALEPVTNSVNSFVARLRDRAVAEASTA